MQAHPPTLRVLEALTAFFLLLSLAFYRDLWGRTPQPEPIALVDSAFTNTATVRVSGAALQAAGEDASAYDCYACHERGKAIEIKLDADQNVLLAEEHKDIVLDHGRHHRNNHCFNCHDSENLERLQTRDGREVKLLESSPLCGSCHGPTYRDWEAGVHGRTSGYWSAADGPRHREACVSCHMPHAPRFPAQKPGPGPTPLRGRKSQVASAEASH